MTMTQAERITALEVTVVGLSAKIESQNQKLDELLMLKNRGVGAFWLASTLVGTGIVTAVLALIDWIKA